MAQQLLYVAAEDENLFSKLLTMPFLATPEDSDYHALRATRANNPELFAKVINHPTVASGITDQWAPVIAALNGYQDPTRLLNPNAVTVQSDTFQTTAGTRVDTILVRSHTGASSAHTMEYLQQAVNLVEAYMAVPFPTSAVIVLIDPMAEHSHPARNLATHITLRNVYDDPADLISAQQTPPILAHEAAHYYWSGNRVWLDEGLANTISYHTEPQRTGQPVSRINPPCHDARNISQLEALIAQGAQLTRHCEYSLGERLFLEVQHVYGPARFRQKLAPLYRLADPSGFAPPGHRPGQAGLRRLAPGGRAHRPLVPRPERRIAARGQRPHRHLRPQPGHPRHQRPHHPCLPLPGPPRRPGQPVLRLPPPGRRLRQRPLLAPRRRKRAKGHPGIRRILRGRLCHQAHAPHHRRRKPPFRRRPLDTRRPPRRQPVARRLILDDDLQQRPQGGPRPLDRQPMSEAQLPQDPTDQMGDLDAALRQTWLECCDHDSIFFLDDYAVRSDQPADEPPSIIDWDSPLSACVLPGASFNYSYHHRLLTHIDILAAAIAISPLDLPCCLAARNLPSACSSCENTATHWSAPAPRAGPHPYCKSCLPADGCRTFPIANSPL